MKKLVVVTVAIALVLGIASVALGAPAENLPYTQAGNGTQTDGVIDTAADGQSMWTYKDVHDAAAKYEGGYASFDDTTTPGGMYTADVGDGTTGQTDTTGPHGGYNTTTNKCKVCHAVHRAEGAYYLLRADSQDDACSYCHIGSAHSTKVVYDLNPDGIYTTNGHTIGAQADIPDSTIRQEAKPVTLTYADSNGVSQSEVIQVRSYDTVKNKMFRFARHHGQAAISYNDTDLVNPNFDQAARGGYQRIGPLALRCMSCHQPHNAVSEVWRPRAFAPFTSATYSTMVDGAFIPTGYKLLRRSPAGAVNGAPNFTSASDPTEYYGGNQVIKAIEDSATPGVNFSQNVSSETTYLENGVVRSMPIWIAQDIHSAEDALGNKVETGVYRYPNKVNNMALSYWCADCHNLNLGGWEPLSEPELGFKAHTERTHPAPYYGAYTGPGQCYSCHRNDLPPQMGLTAAANPVRGGALSQHGGVATPGAITGASRNGCTECHFGTGDYYAVRQAALTTPALKSDFPHSGSENDIKMLGAYNVTGDPTQTAWAPVYNAATITEGSLDQVCLRCHPGIGVNH